MPMQSQSLVYTQLPETPVRHCKAPASDCVRVILSHILECQMYSNYFG